MIHTVIITGGTSQGTAHVAYTRNVYGTCIAVSTYNVNMHMHTACIGTMHCISICYTSITSVLLYYYVYLGKVKLLTLLYTPGKVFLFFKPVVG